MAAPSEGSTWVVKELLATSVSSKMQLAGSFLGMGDSRAQQIGWNTQFLATGLDTVMGFMKERQAAIAVGEVVHWSNYRGLIAAGLLKTGLTVAQNPNQASQVAFMGAVGMMDLDICLTIACPPAGAALWIFTGVALLADAIGVYAAYRSLPKAPDFTRALAFKKTILQGASGKHFYNWQFDPADPMSWFPLTRI